MRPTCALISRSAFAHNLKLIRDRIGTGRRMLCAVKANAYGHGLLESAYILAEVGADWFGVATGTEALALRKAGFAQPILILGTLLPDDDDIFELINRDISLTVCNRELAEVLNAAAARTGNNVNVHLKVDTGMGRIGVWQNDVRSFLDVVRNLKQLRWEGIFTHFPLADATDKSFTLEQIRNFQILITDLNQAGYKFKYHHAANSGAIIDVPDTFLNLVRSGIMIYGLYPSEEVNQEFGLQQVMTLETQVAFLKHVPAGRSISYGRTFITKRPSVIATLPIGYGDGYNRRLSNRGEVIIRGQRVPIIGRVCMDQTCIDVTDVPGVTLGDPVVCYGRQGEAEISIGEVARELGTITYEVTCWLSARVPRIVVD